MKTTVIISGLLLILLANVMMVYYRPRRLEYFEDNAVAAEPVEMPSGPMDMPAGPMDMPAGPMDMPAGPMDMPAQEGFASFYLENAGGAKEKYNAIGAFDGVKLSTGNSVSGWRYTAPNEPLNGAEFKPGDDSLFMFKNNQCKPECCGASFSCGGGCVCTTPQQRQYIAGRGGNRNQPEDSL
jgi:hypothetical protein